MVTDIVRRWLVGVALYWGIPFEILHREFPFRGFRGCNAIVMLYRRVLYRGLTVCVQAYVRIYAPIYVRVYARMFVPWRWRQCSSETLVATSRPHPRAAHSPHLFLSNIPAFKRGRYWLPRSHSFLQHHKLWMNEWMVPPGYPLSMWRMFLVNSLNAYNSRKVARRRNLADNYTDYH
jgi:hypothetical protein